MSNSDHDGSDAPEGGGVKGFLKRVGVLTDDDKDGATGHPTPAKAPAASTAHPSVATASPQYSAFAPAAVDQAMRAELERLLQEPARPAFSAFQVLEQKMRTKLPDERTRITAALASVEAQGHDTSAVLQDIDECLALLATKEEQADAKLTASLEQRVSSIASEVQAATDQIAAAQAQIATLQQQIGEAERKRSERQAAVTTEQQKNQAKRGSLKATVADIRRGLETAKQKLREIGQR